MNRHRTRRAQLLRLAFGDRAAQPIAETGIPNRMRVNGATVTHSVVNAWLADKWCRMQMGVRGGVELRLTPEGMEVIQG